LALSAKAPNSFAGILYSITKIHGFFPINSKGKPDDIDKLWNVFDEALKSSPLSTPEFEGAFDKALGVRYTNINLTIGLFWIGPRVFLNLDGTMRGYLKNQTSYNWAIVQNLFTNFGNGKTRAS